MTANSRVRWRRGALMLCALLVFAVPGCARAEDEQERPHGSRTIQTVRRGAREGNMSQWIEFDMLRQSRGAAYRQQRDAILRSTPDLKRRVGNYQTNPEWEVRIIARILEGWADHGQLYTQILAELDAVDVRRESATIIGISRIWDAFGLRAGTEFGAEILPLCWEALLKFVNVWPDWKVITFLHMIASLPDENSVEPTVFFMEQTNDSGAQDLAGRVLQLLPADRTRVVITERLDALEAEAQHNPATAARTQQLRQILRNVLERVG